MQIRLGRRAVECFPARSRNQEATLSPLERSSGSCVPWAISWFDGDREPASDALGVFIVPVRRGRGGGAPFRFGTTGSEARRLGRSTRGILPSSTTFADSAAP